MVEALISTINGVKNQIADYIVAPIALFGLGGFVFDVEGETDITLSTEITDHFLEDNSTVQDHIAIRPKRIKLSSYVGELVYSNEETSTQQTEKVARKLVVLSSYLPPLTQGLSQAQSLLSGGSFGFQDVASNVLNIYQFIKNSFPPQSKQQQAYQYFKALMESRILLSVQTPFEFCSNMAIENIFAVQDESTRSMSTFSVTLKQIRVVNTEFGTLSRARPSLQDRAGLQSQSVQNGGKIQGTNITQPVDLIYNGEVL